MLDYGFSNITFEPPNHAFAHYHNIIYYWTSNMNIMSLKQIEFFMEKIVHYGCFYVCENFHEQIPIKIYVS
jgi:hypothetical protein